MEGAQVFSCNTGNKGLFGKSNSADALFLKVESDKVSGKGYVCNEEGKNGYLDDFSFAIAEIKNVFVGDYYGQTALGFNARVANLYGAKKVQILLPQLKNMNQAVGLINRLKSSAENSVDVRSAASSRVAQPQPVSAQAPKVQHQPVDPVEEKASVSWQPVAEERTLIVTPEPMPAEPVVEEQDLSSEEFQKRMDKLTILRDCGLLGEKEFTAKKIELVSEYCDLADFNEKIQKLIVLKDCGLLSEKEFEANRIDIIKECCNTETTDMKEYRKSVQKLSFLEMGGVITAEEYEKNKQILIDDAEFALSDSKEVFARKLQKLPILKETQLITEKEYKQKIDAMYTMIEVSTNDPLAKLADKLNKWPVLAQERLISVAELKEKQKTLVDNYLNEDWNTTDELEDVIKKMMALKQGEWLAERDYIIRREAIFKKIATLEDSVAEISCYRMMYETGFVSEDDYLKQRQKSIDEIFKPCASMEEFKFKVNSLLEFQKAGIITEKEFASFKAKLMSEL